MEYNKKYFDGSLPMPEIFIGNKKRSFGTYYRMKGLGKYRQAIEISNYFDRPEKDVCQTLIHEMIHYYLDYHNINDRGKHHGPRFYAMADIINRDGWVITRCSSSEGMALTNGGNTYYVVVYKTKSGKYFRFCINPNKIDYYRSYLLKYPDHFQNPIIYTSTNDIEYSRYALCRSSIRGFYISEEEYDRVISEEKILFDLRVRKDVA
jgi:hypothetical protein